MTPYMAQGAATAMEDAASWRAVSPTRRGCPDGILALRSSPEAADLTHPAISSANTWMKGGNDDTSWLYGYDAWNVPLNEPALNPAS
jgi:salicylate hydroxylase/6-hydroxynicotinate 3-monooxygenase